MDLLEQTFSNSLRVDRESMVIRGVKVCGKKSANGREYSIAALDKLAGLYEGITVNIDHDRASPNTERKMADGFGVLKNVRREADGAVGDLHYLKEHQLAPMVLERAERMPDTFGLSHVAVGKVVRRKGVNIVEDVMAVKSVDIVREPATTKGLFESQDTEGGFDMAVMTIREIVEAVPKETPGVDLLQEQMDAGMVAADEPVEVAADTGPGDQVKAAFRAAVMEAFDDDSLDMKATIARIKEILTAQEKLKPKAKEEPAEEPTEEEPTESVDHAALIAKLQATNLLLEAGRDATPERVKAVAAMDESERQQLVESWPSKENRQRPTSSPPKHRDDGTIEFPRDTKKFAARLR